MDELVDEDDGFEDVQEVDEDDEQSSSKTDEKKDDKTESFSLIDTSGAPDKS